MIRKSLTWLVINSLVVLLVVGCGKGTTDKKEAVAMGRYIEQDIQIEGFNPEATSFLLKSKNNRFQLYQQQETGFVIFEEQDDLSWQKIEPSWLEPFNKEYGGKWICAMNLDEEGQPYFVTVGEVAPSEEEQQQEKVSEEETSNTDEFVVSDSDKNTRTTVIRMEGAEIKTYELKIDQDLPYIIPSHLVVLGERDIVLSGGYSQQRRFNLDTGTEVKKYSDDDGAIELVSGKLSLLNLTDSQVDLYNLSGDQVVKSVPYDNIDETSVIVSGENKDLYMVTKKGIAHFAEGASLWEQLMDSNGLSLGLPSYELVAAVEKEQRFMVLLTNDQYQKVIRQYVYSETTPTLPEVELTAYTLKESKTLQELLIAYQLQHPEVRINLQVGLSDEAGITKEDAIKALNTEILAGQGPDLILLDSLPLDTYMEKGVLADLSDLGEKEQLFAFAIQPFTKNNGLYAMPLRFTVPTFWGDSKMINSIENMKDLAAYQNQHPEESVFFKRNAENLITAFMSQSQDKWFNEKGELQEIEIIEFLETIQTFAINDEKEVVTKGFEDAIDIYVLSKMAFGESQIFTDDVGSVLDLLTCNTANKERGKAIFSLMKQDGKRVYKPRGIMSINQSCQNKEVAKQVVGFMLSQDVQLTDTGEGFPSNRGAFEKWIGGETTNKDVVYSFGVSMEQVLSVEWGYEKELATFYEEVKQIEQPLLVDETLMALIIEGTKPYFEGSQTAQEVVSAIKPQLELYSKE